LSKYTTELRYLIQNDFDLGLQDYPIHTFTYNPLYKGVDYRTVLNDKIKEHYYFREIGLETPALFKRMLNRKMNEIMPYYNQMYESIDIEFNPLDNVNLTETFTHSVTDNGTTTGTGSVDTNGNNTNHETLSNTRTEDLSQTTGNTNEDINIHQDTPQSGITEDDIKLNNYASSADHNKSTNEQTTTNDNTVTDAANNTITNTNSSSQNSTNEINNNNTRTETYTKNEKGSSAGYLFTQNIEQWRKIMINIDMQIMEELEPLFMQLW
jgi:hypothetical protein